MSHSPKLSPSSPSHFFLPFFPYPHPIPTPKSPNFCLAILSTSNIQETNYMIFFGFTFLFSFLGSRIIGSKTFNYG